MHLSLRWARARIYDIQSPNEMRRDSSRASMILDTLIDIVENIEKLPSKMASGLKGED